MAEAVADSQNRTEQAGAPSYDADLFSDDAIADPYPHYAALRDAGPAVWLPRHGLWAIPRFEGVQHALRNTAVFSSARGVAANDTVNTLSAGTTLASDPPLHKALRRIIVAPLRPAALVEIRPLIEAEAAALVERLVARGRFDAVTDLAQHLPLTIVSDLVGLPWWRRNWPRRISGAPSPMAVPFSVEAVRLAPPMA